MQQSNQVWGVVLPTTDHPLPHFFGERKFDLFFFRAFRYFAIFVLFTNLLPFWLLPKSGKAQ